VSGVRVMFLATVAIIVLGLAYFTALGVLQR
jgi:hypothetical protein